MFAASTYDEIIEYERLIENQEIVVSIVVIGTPKEWNVSRRYFTPTFFFSHVSAVQWLQ